MKKSKKIIITIISLIIIIVIIIVSGILIHKKKVEKRIDEANRIIEIVNKIYDFNQLYEKDNPTVVDKEVEECDAIIEELHKENSSGRVDDELKDMMDNSIKLAEAHRKALDCFSSNNISLGEMNAWDYYSKYIDEENKYKTQLDNEVERLSAEK